MVLHVVRRVHLGSSLLLPLQPQLVEWKDGGEASSFPYPAIRFDVFLSSSPGPPFVPLPRKGMDEVACSQEGTIQYAALFGTVEGKAKRADLMVHTQFRVAQFVVARVTQHVLWRY